MLVLKKNEHIKGGKVEWEYNVETEELHYWGKIHLKVGPLGHTVKFDETVIVSKEKMFSKNALVGTHIPLEEGGTVEVVSNDGKVAGVVICSEQYCGSGNISVESEIIDVLTVCADAKVMGVKFHIDACKDECK